MDDYKLSFRNLPLSHPLVEAKLTDGFAIMLHLDDRRTWKKRRGHYRPHRDTKGWYIRTGKRGTCKEYLTICEVTYDHGTPLLFQFRTKDGLPLHGVSDVAR